MPSYLNLSLEILKKHTIGLLILLGAAHGLLYVFLIPPWQHYDEPGNFEYAWLIANREIFPQWGEYDQSMRREVAASMIEYGFYENLGSRPNLLSINEPIYIGISQTSDPPLYYQLVSLPLRLLRGIDITFQLYVGRLISWVLFLTCIQSAWGILKELTQPKHPLRWMMPLSLALLPGFVDIMTAVNNDVGATAFFSLFLWGSVSTIRRGLTWKKIFWITGTTILCLFTKATVYFVLPLLLIAVLFGIFREKRLKWAWSLIGVSAVAVLLMTFTWGEVTHWYRHAPYNYKTRYEHSEALVGDHVFLFTIQKGKTVPRISQVLTPSILDAMRGNTVTTGAWVWADSPVTVRLPILNDGEENTTKTVEIGRQPSFYTYRTNIREDISQGYILLSPLPPQSQEDVNIYYDGVVIAVGNYSRDNPPNFDDSMGQKGTWGGRSFDNLLNNPSAESGGIGTRPRVDVFIQKYFPINPSWALNSLLDWSKTAWYYKSAAVNLHRTFWAKFGWGHVSLLGSKPYRALAGLTFLGLIGAVGYLLHRKSDLPWEMISLFGLAILFIWGAAVFRGVSSAFATSNRVFIPAARYAYPAIIPTMMVLNIGWLEIIRLLQWRTRVSKSILVALYILFFIALDILSIISIYHFYNR